MKVIGFFLAFLSCSSLHANPFKVAKYDKDLLSELPQLQKSQIAFIDLSARKMGPKISLTNLEGAELKSISIPSDRYINEWTHWGPGITYDQSSKSIWYLAPKLGLTEFSLNGEILRKVNFLHASHQIQVTPNGNFVLPYSWDTKEDFQISEIDQNGKAIFQWKAHNFVEKFARSDAIAHAQPPSFTATTSAVKTNADNFYLSLSQKNLILKLNKNGEVTWQKEVPIRPHTLVVDGDNLIGYSARNPNRVVLYNLSCNCFKEVLIEEQLGGKANTRTLSLQYLGKGLWFTSGVTGLYILNDEGRIFWKLENDGLRGRPIGFHAAVLFFP